MFSIYEFICTRGKTARNGGVNCAIAFEKGGKFKNYL